MTPGNNQVPQPNEPFGAVTRIGIEGYKSIRRLEQFPLGDINILLGANGAGKSNFIGLFRLIGHLANGDLQPHLASEGGPEAILTRTGQPAERLRIFLQSHQNEYEAVLEPVKTGGFFFSKERIAWHHAGKDWIISSPGQLETNLDKAGPASGVREHTLWALREWRLFHFHDTSRDSRLRGSSLLSSGDKLDSDGRNLPAFLYRLREEAPGPYRDIENSVAAILPYFHRFELREEDSKSGPLVRLRWKHRQAPDYDFDVSELSDGSLRFIAMMALLLQPEPPRTIALDEPELGLHPYALAVLADTMHSVSRNIQIVCSTQSPEFADHFSPEDIIVIDASDGESALKRLEPDDYKLWRDEYAPGAAFTRGLIGGRP